jgi:hypothetical protein
MGHRDRGWLGGREQALVPVFAEIGPYPAKSSGIARSSPALQERLTVACEHEAAGQAAARLRVQSRADDRLAAGLGRYGVAGPAGDPAP